MRIEQAIFTSIRGDRLEGYQLAATSPGVDAELARRLTAWGPAHDSLLDPSAGASSVNFHPLDDDRFALSKTTRQGEEYSGRGGGRIVTQFFVLDKESLSRFANLPLAILRALVASGRTRFVEPIPARLMSFALVGRATGAGTDTSELDTRALDRLVEAIRKQTPTSVICSHPPEVWLPAVYARLGLDERLLLSFTTGLRPSACRPFLVSVIPDEPSLVRQSQRTGGAVVYLSPESVAVAD